MTVSIDRPTVIEPAHRTSIWNRASQRLNNWGNKIKAVAKKVGNWFTRTAKWIWNIAPVQWVASKAKWLGARAWHYAKGPIGWVAVPIAAIIFAPKAVAVMLLLVLVLVGALAYATYRLYREVKKSSPEEIQGLVEDVRTQLNEVGNGDNGKQLAYNDEPMDPSETLSDRYAYLDNQHMGASDASDAGRFSEITGRLWLLEVRSQSSSEARKLKKNASASLIYRDARRRAEHDHPNFDWDFGRMSNAVRSEDARVRALNRLKAEQGNLTNV